MNMQRWKTGLRNMARLAAIRMRLAIDRALGSDRRLRLPRALLYGIAGMTIAILLWSAFFHVEQVVRVSGRIIPVSKPQMVQHLEGGIVSQVLVHEGDMVNEGQDLLVMSDERAGSQYAEKEIKAKGLQVRVARLLAEANGKTEFLPPAGVDKSDKDFQTEWQVFTARRDRLEQTLHVLDQQIAQRREEARVAEGRASGLQAELKVAKDQLAVYNKLLGTGAASTLELLEAQARVERFTTQLEETRSSLPKLLAAVRELQGKRNETLSQFRSEAQTGLAEARLALDQTREEVKVEADRFRRTVVKAPRRGIVNRLYVTTIGGVVKPGDPVTEITPVDDRIVVEARARPTEMANLRASLPSTIRVAAYDFAVYGALKGQVSEISADTIQDERGERYYRIRIDVDPEEIRAFGRTLLPGMTVTADIKTGARTILQYVFVPAKRFARLAFRDSR